MDYFSISCFGLPYLIFSHYHCLENDVFNTVFASLVIIYIYYQINLHILQLFNQKYLKLLLFLFIQLLYSTFYETLWKFYVWKILNFD